MIVSAAGQAANACTVLALLVFAVWAVSFCCRRARAAGDLCDRIIRETHDRAEAAREIDPLELAYALPSYTRPDPELDAGCERLWDAIRDEQQNGEQA